MPIRITGLNSGLDTDAIVQDLMSAYRTKTDGYKKAQTKLSWKQDAWKEMNSKIYGFYSKTLSNLRMAGNFTSKKLTTVSDSSKATIIADNSVVNGTQILEIKKLATAGYLTGTTLNTGAAAKLSQNSLLSELGIQNGTLKLQVGGETKEVEVKADMKISDLLSALKAQGVNASFDEGQQRFFLNSSASGKGNDFSFDTSGASGTASLDILSKLGLAAEQNYKEAGVTVPPHQTLATKVEAQSAEIVLNGATFTSDTNEFSINGLKITATGVTAGSITVSTSTDVDGIYNMIKDFFKEYNSLVNSMEKAFNAKSSKGYEPLTNEEKGELSEDEVKEWEKKIKDSLLRRDDTLSSVLSAMSTAMTRTIEIDGEKYSLASFGIKTASYFIRAENESYAYHIDGDKEDASVEGNADKLKKMIAENPEAVTEFFTKMAKNVHDTLSEKMKKTSLSSSLTVYNNIQLQKEYDDYSETIAKWEEKLKVMEDRYYKQFSAMETALAKLQSQSNSFMSMLGG